MDYETRRLERLYSALAGIAEELDREEAAAEAAGLDDLASDVSWAACKVREAAGFLC